ncbi:MAG: hypothetical protein RLY86_631 [Pseudomonadota bacterium]|jgi:hypothetical protein
MRVIPASRTEAPDLPNDIGVLIDLTRWAVAVLTDRPAPEPAPVAASGSLPDLVEQHHLAPLLERAMARSGWQDLPAALQRAIRDSARARARRTLAQIALQDRIADGMAAAGLPWLALKGPAVSSRIFATPTARMSVDLDILVRLDDLEAVDGLLTGLGLRRVHPHPDRPLPWRWPAFRRWDKNTIHVSAQTGVMVECHWRPFCNPTLLDLDFDGVWTRRSHARPGRRDVPVLATTDLFLYLAIHGAAHSWIRLKWLVDILALMPVLSGEECRSIVATAGANGLDTIVRQTVDYCALLFGSPGPEPFGQVGGCPPALWFLDRMARRLLISPVPTQSMPLGEILAVKARNFALKPTLATAVEIIANPLFRPDTGPRRP